jgi:hypothetical protein
MHSPNALRVSMIVIGLCVSTSYARAQDIQYASDSPTYLTPSGSTIQAIGTQSFYYNTNPLLLTTGASALWGSITSPELIVGDKTPTSLAALDTIFSSNNFNQSDFNSNDVHSKLNLSDQNERWTTSFQGNVDYDTTRTSEISIYNNVNTLPVRHLGESFTPDVTYNFLPTDKLGLTGNYSQSTYGNTTFTDYDSYSVTPSYTHNFDARNAGIFSLEAQRYSALDNGTDITDTVGPSVGWQTIFTDRLSGNAAIGFQETREKTSLDSTPWTTEYNYAAGLNYKGIKDLLNFDASRSEYPFGNGTEALLTQVNLKETHNINSLFSIGGQGGYQSATYPQNADGDLKSLITGSGNLTYHATDHIDIAATYVYEDETLIGNSSSAHSNTALLSVTYHPANIGIGNLIPSFK